MCLTSYFTAIPGLSGVYYGYRLASFHRWRVRFIRPYPVRYVPDYVYIYSVTFYPSNTPTAEVVECAVDRVFVFRLSCGEVGNLKRPFSHVRSTPSFVEAPEAVPR